MWKEHLDREADAHARCALAKWLSWLEHRPAHLKFAGLIPGQDTRLGYEFNPLSGRVQEATNQCFALSLSLSLSLSPFIFLLKSIKKQILR